MIVLSHYQTAPLLAARAAGEGTAVASLDLGRSQLTLSLTPDGVSLPDGTLLSWGACEEIAANENACYHIVAGQPQKIQFFSELTQRAYSLFPTQSAPTMLVSGITMHRIVGTDPHQDTLSKIKAIGGALLGRVLDTTMGLGYTAIEAARSAGQVTTIELDPTVVEVCRLNPWSQELFTLPNIERHIGHAWDVIEEFPNGRFNAIIHDPPMFNMAGELYAQDFYAELYRVLAPKGRLFHYIGNPESRSGATVTRGAIKRLKGAGFRRVSPRPRAFGVLAAK